MALPKLDVPSYEVELPISKTKIKFRPFLVKEQRNLLMAIEADDSVTIQQSIRDILNNCTLTENIDIDSLPIIDIEYYFVQLRSKSVGETVESRYRCNNVVNDKLCNNIMEKEINLSEIKVQQKEEISPEIQITDKITIKLKYPQFGVVKESLKFENANDITFNMIANSIEYIYDGDQFYYDREARPGEMLEFVESMNQEQFKKIENFFENLPKLKETLQLKCSKCGFDHTIEVEGLENFFG
jgi:hypothetical protein